MSQPDQTEPRGAARPNPGQRTEKLLMPNNWMRELPGGWLYWMGAAPPGDEFDVMFFGRGDDPNNPASPEWTMVLQPARDGDLILRNPVTFEGPDDEKHEFWPDCIEDLEALLLQVGRYGYAQPAPGGWKVEATVTAAAARAAAADEDFRHTVNRPDGVGWVFTETGTPVPIAPEPSSQATPGDARGGIRTKVSEQHNRAPRRGTQAPAGGHAPRRPGTAGARHEVPGGRSGGRGRS